MSFLCSSTSSIPCFIACSESISSYWEEDALLTPSMARSQWRPCSTQSSWCSSWMQLHEEVGSISGRKTLLFFVVQACNFILADGKTSLTKTISILAFSELFDLNMCSSSVEGVCSVVTGMQLWPSSGPYLQGCRFPLMSGSGWEAQKMG